jgi:hypothetical protein
MNKIVSFYQLQQLERTNLWRILWFGPSAKRLCAVWQFNSHCAIVLLMEHPPAHCCDSENTSVIKLLYLLIIYDVQNVHNKMNIIL